MMRPLVASMLVASCVVGEAAAVRRPAVGANQTTGGFVTIGVIGDGVGLPDGPVAMAGGVIERQEALVFSDAIEEGGMYRLLTLGLTGRFVGVGGQSWYGPIDDVAVYDETLVAVGSDAMTGIASIVRLKVSGEHMWSKPISGTGIGRPSLSIAVDEENELIWVASNAGWVLGFSENGRVVERIRVWTNDPVIGLAVTQDGAVLLGIRSGGKMVSWDPASRSTNVTALQLPSNSLMRDFAVSKDDWIVVTEDGVAWRLAPSGALIESWWAGGLDEMTAPGSVAVFEGEKIAIADYRAGLVRIFQWQSNATGPPSPPRLASQAGRCAVEIDKTAAPVRVRLGDPVTVTLHVSASCQTEPDQRAIVLLVDVSGSVWDEFAAVQRAAIAFVTSVSQGIPIALVTFGTEPRLRMPPTTRHGDVVKAVGELEPGEGTRIDRALKFADQASQMQIGDVVLITDGGLESPVGLSEYEEGRGLRAAGIRLGIFTVCLRCASLILEDVFSRAAGNSGSGRYVSEAIDVDLREWAAEIGSRRSRIAEVGLERGVVWDRLAQVMQLESATVSNAGMVNGREIRWLLSDLDQSWTATYQVRPQQIGMWRTSDIATLEFVDGLGNPGQLVFPAPLVEVWSPTPVATPTVLATLPPTTTPTASSIPPTVTVIAPPSSIFLPLALFERCDPTEQRIDVVMVIDASSSMNERTRAGRPKIDAALDAAREFLDLLQFDGAAGDQAAIVAFNSDARLLAPLTSDRSVLDAALLQIALAQQTRLDRAVAVGAAVLEDASRRRPANQPILILLTDGRANPVPVEVAVVEAERAKATGVGIFTIGLGDDLDADALSRMSSRPQDFLRAPDAEDLADIYRTIARSIPCPPTAWWGGR